MTTTLQRRWRESLGYQFVEEGYALPIMRNERVHRFVVGPEYVYLNPFTEYALKPINIGYRTNKFQVAARTADRNNIEVKGLGAYLFNPNNANVQVRAQITKAVAKSDQPIKDMLGGALGIATREFVATKSILEMASGAIQLQLETYLRSTLKTLLRPYGIQLAELQENGVIIGIKGIQVQQILLPDWLTNYISIGQFAGNALTDLQLSPELITNQLFNLKKVEQASFNGNLIYVTPESATNLPFTRLLNQGKGQSIVNGNGRSEEAGHRNYAQSATNGNR